MTTQDLELDGSVITLKLRIQKGPFGNSLAEGGSI